MTPEQLAKSGSEHAHQRALFARIAEYTNQQKAMWSGGKLVLCAQLNLLFAIPNGGERHKAVAGKMKAEGAKSGVYDLFLPVPRDYVERHEEGVTQGHYNGLFVEMKEPGRRNHKDGGLSDNQIIFRDNMQAQGFAMETCYTWDEAFNVLLKYLGG